MAVRSLAAAASCPAVEAALMGILQFTQLDPDLS
ncbi:hypothetical protein HaLaN_08693 [Haematococcus lacustris]|uniref:Uncharacterized protein n=1 Tax=Haematococcus lacustris TaxID=44745 RepID=A0A699ZBS6_HAELA|nr:hypothetical protein HaLaN_08693 [Haematococcus lacustris]